MRPTFRVCLLRWRSAALLAPLPVQPSLGSWTYALLEPLESTDGCCSSNRPTRTSPAPYRRSRRSLRSARSRSVCRPDIPLSVVSRSLAVRLLTETPQDHDRLVPALLPWLLEPQPMLRVLVATCLLRCSSTATTLVLRPSLRPISETISRALLPLQRPGATSSSTTLRFISLLLRIYTALFLRLSPVPTEVVAASIAVLSVWVYHRAALHGTASSVPHRGRPVLDAAALGAFTSSNQSPQKGSVIRRSPSWSSSRDGSSGSEDEAGKGERFVPPWMRGITDHERRHSSAQVRLDALACLRTLALVRLPLCAIPLD